jgi:hypothetical protein
MFQAEMTEEARAHEVEMELLELKAELGLDMRPFVPPSGRGRDLVLELACFSWEG